MAAKFPGELRATVSGGSVTLNGKQIPVPDGDVEYKLEIRRVDGGVEHSRTINEPIVSVTLSDCKNVTMRIYNGKAVVEGNSTGSITAESSKIVIKGDATDRINATNSTVEVKGNANAVHMKSSTYVAGGSVGRMQGGGAVVMKYS